MGIRPPITRGRALRVLTALSLSLSLSLASVALAALPAGAGALVNLPLGPSGAHVQPYGKNDFGGFRNVLPPGTNGLVDALQLGSYLSTGARPPHNNDQLSMYDSLTTAVAAASTEPSPLPCRARNHPCGRSPTRPPATNRRVLSRSAALEDLIATDSPSVRAH